MATEARWLEPTSGALERGRVEYVSGRYHAAHLAWLEPWRQETGPIRLLLQGLIQAAGAYLKLAHGNPAGMAILLERALALLGPLPAALGGLDLARLRAGLRRSLAEAVAWRAGGPVPGGPARLGRARPLHARAAQDGRAGPPRGGPAPDLQDGGAGP